MVTAREVPPESRAAEGIARHDPPLRRRQWVLLVAGALAAAVAAAVLWFVPSERLVSFVWSTWEPISTGSVAPIVSIDTEAGRLTSNMPRGLADEPSSGDFVGLDWIVSGYAGSSPGVLRISGPDAMLPIALPLDSGAFFLLENGGEPGWLRTSAAGAYEIRFEPDGDAAGLVLSVSAQRLERGRVWNGPGPGFPIGLGLVMAAAFALTVAALAETVAMGRIAGALLAAAAAAVPIALTTGTYWFGKPGLAIQALAVLAALGAGVAAVALRRSPGRRAPARLGIAALAISLLFLSWFLVIAAGASVTDVDGTSLAIYASLFAVAAVFTAVLAAAVATVKRPTQAPGESKS